MSVSPKRKGLLAKCNIGRKQLDLDESAWRELLANHFRKDSLKGFSDMELARLVDVLANKGAVFTSPKKTKQYKTGAAGRRSDFYEIHDSDPLAALKRKACALWRELGYDLLKLDTRTRRQSGFDALRFAAGPKGEAFLSDLIVDLNKRLKRQRGRSDEA